jgi:hypothetical protein
LRFGSTLSLAWMLDTRTVRMRVRMGIIFFLWHSGTGDLSP